PLLFAFASAAGLVALAAARESGAGPRRRLALGFAAAAALVVAAAFGGRLLQYTADDRVAVGGTGGMLSALAAEAAEIEAAAAAIRSGTSDDGGLVCFPEGQVLNFLSGRRVPIRRDLFIPGYLTSSNEGEVLAELSRHPPEAVVIWRRPAGEYGEGFFGESYARRLREWIEREYVARQRRERRPKFALAFRRAR
ncbi:MAG TPA: hypothetical protein VGS00_04160, partial [Thermoanaerobaculia bacterium]|nr:hypothetical protein [Thermoanaerobaculia bacterium]